jgi:magnesium transporter
VSQDSRLPTEDGALRSWIAETDAHTLAQALNRADPVQRSRIFRALPPEKLFAVFAQLEPTHQADLLPGMEEGELKALINAMEPDDRVRMFVAMPTEAAARLLTKLEEPELRSTRLLLQYPKETAGRIMSPEFIALSPDMRVSDALAAVRREHERAETIYFLPVTDAAGALTGAVELEDLVLSVPEARIRSVMKHVPTVSAFDDQEVVSRLMKNEDLMAVAVVDEGDRLVGIITFDDAMEILEFEEGEDIARGGGSEPFGQPYFSVSIARLVRARVVWLSVLAVAATLTVNVLDAFESILQNVVTLALFIPLLIGIGGNTGAQSATTVVRALAVNDVGPEDALRVAIREALTGLLLGAVIGLAGFLIVWIVFERDIAFIVAAALVTICTLAALVGSIMPILARSLGVDPAVFSAPFVTTVTDATGLMVYFLIARAVLGI